MEQDQSDLGNDDQELTRQNLREAARRIDDENEQVEAENYLLHRRVNVAGQENIHPNASTIYYPPEGGANTSVREASEEIAAAAAGREGGNNTVAESFAPNESESGIWTSRIEEIPAEEAQPIILPTPTPALPAPSVHMDSIDTTQSTNTTQQSIQNDDSVPMDYDIENVPPQIHEFLNNPNHPPPMENEIEIPSINGYIENVPANLENILADFERFENNREQENPIRDLVPAAPTNLRPTIETAALPPPAVPFPPLPPFPPPDLPPLPPLPPPTELPALPAPAPIAAETPATAPELPAPPKLPALPAPEQVIRKPILTPAKLPAPTPPLPIEQEIRKPILAPARLPAPKTPPPAIEKPILAPARLPAPKTPPPAIEQKKKTPSKLMTAFRNKKKRKNSFEEEEDKNTEVADQISKASIPPTKRRNNSLPRSIISVPDNVQTALASVKSDEEESETVPLDEMIVMLPATLNRIQADYEIRTRSRSKKTKPNSLTAEFFDDPEVSQITDLKKKIKKRTRNANWDDADYDLPAKNSREEEINLKKRIRSRKWADSEAKRQEFEDSDSSDSNDSIDDNNE
jgi:hypothetical protein